MRVARTLSIGSVVVATSIGIAASPATADGGGAYLNFDRTHYLPGQTAVGRTSVAIPLGRRTVLDEGPFYAYLITGNRWPTPGDPLPDDVMRIGTFTFHHRHGARFDLIARLTIPDVRGDFYSVGLCNDPCTIDGFSQPVTGYLSIVQTKREAMLLNEVQHRRARIGDLRHELRTNRKELARTSSTLTFVERDDRQMNAEVSRLKRALAVAKDRRPSLETWAVAAAFALLLAALAVAILGRRRRRTPRVLGTALRPTPVRIPEDERVG